MAHMNLQHINPKSFSLLHRKEKRRHDANLLCTAIFQELIVNYNLQSWLFWGHENATSRTSAFLKWKAWRFFSLRYDSFPFVRTIAKLSVDWNYYIESLTHGAVCCHLQHKRVAKSMFLSSPYVLGSYIFLKFRFSVVKCTYTVIQMS